MAGGDPLTAGDLIWVISEVSKFDIASTDRKIGAGIAADVLDAYVGTPATIADTLSLKLSTSAGEEDGA